MQGELKCILFLGICNAFLHNDTYDFLDIWSLLVLTANFAPCHYLNSITYQRGYTELCNFSLCIQNLYKIRWKCFAFCMSLCELIWTLPCIRNQLSHKASAIMQVYRLLHSLILMAVQWDIGHDLQLTIA